MEGARVHVSDSLVFLFKGPIDAGCDATDCGEQHVRLTIHWMTSSRHIAHGLITQPATKHEQHRSVRMKLDGRVAAVMSPAHLVHEVLSIPSLQVHK